MFASFLVPVYNTEKYLHRCIDSLLIQKGADFEIVLLDDGSTDSSGAICDRYAAQYPDIVRVIHKENEGLLLTRRRGFREAKGEWFLCVDSDDYVAPELLETVANAIAAHADCDMVMFNFEYFFENGTRAPSRLTIADGTVYSGCDKQHIYRQRLLSVDVNMMWMRAIKREILDMDTDYSTSGIRNMCEDALQVLPLYTNAKKIVYLDNPLYCYRKGSDSITGQQTIANWNASRICFSETEKYLEIWKVSEETAGRFYTKHLEYLANYVRWLFSAEPEMLPASVSEMLADLSFTSDYRVCRKHYNREYSHSRYLSMLIPVLVRLIDRKNISGIRLVFTIEKYLLKLRK